jgi:hypothetical protein
MKRKKCLLPVLCIVIGLFLLACAAGNKEAATVAIKAAEDSYNVVKGEALKYIPDQAKGVEDAIKAAKENFDKGNFDAALSAAKPIPDKVKELTTAVATKKAELAKSWEEMSGGLPKMLDTIKSRLDILSASKKLPENLDKAKLEGAKTGYEAATKMWDDAKSAFAGGNMADAVSKAKTVKERAVEVMSTLGMQAPAAAATKG